MFKLAFVEAMGKLYLLLVNETETDFKRIANHYANRWIDRWVDPDCAEQSKEWARQQTDLAWNGIMDETVREILERAG